MFKGLSLDQAPPEDIPFRFFFTAPLFGIVAGILILYTGKYLFADRWLMELIAFTHIFTLGWLSMVMMGAFYQMIPVMIGGTVPYIKLARGVHALFLLGSLSLIGGLYFGLDKLMVSAMILISLSVTCFIAQMLTALFRVRADRPTVTAMRISILSFLATLLFGIYLAGVYAALWSFEMDKSLITSSHITVALLGWVGALIMGVSFHVIPMFFMSDNFPPKHALYITRALIVSLILVPVAFLTDHTTLAFWAGLPSLLALIYFGIKIASLIKNRKRKRADYALNFWGVSIASLLTSLIVFSFGYFLNYGSIPIIFALLFIIGFGIFTTNGMLYKILPFLVWFHRFSHQVGIVPVPLLKDILPEAGVKKQFWMLLSFFIILILGIVFDQDFLIRIAGLMLILSSTMLFYNFIKICGHKIKQ